MRGLATSTGTAETATTRQEPTQHLALHHRYAAGGDPCGLDRGRLKVCVLESRAVHVELDDGLADAVGAGELGSSGGDGKHLVVVRTGARRLEIPSIRLVPPLRHVPTARVPGQLERLVRCCALSRSARDQGAEYQRENCSNRTAESPMKTHDSPPHPRVLISSTSVHWHPEIRSTSKLGQLSGQPTLGLTDTSSIIRLLAVSGAGQIPTAGC